MRQLGMEESERKAQRKRFWQTLIFYSVLTILFVVMSVNFQKSFSMNRTLKQSHDSLLNTYSDMQHTNAELDSLMRALQFNDAEAIEWVARYQWHLARPGEKVFQLVPDGSVSGKSK